MIIIKSILIAAAFVLKFELISANSDSNSANSHSLLIPPGALGSNQSEFNVTGSLNSFVEQIQANNANGGGGGNQAPPVQMPAVPQGHGSVIYYGSGASEMIGNGQPALAPQLIPFQPTPIQINPHQQPTVIMGGAVAAAQPRPTLDPALQQLLNSFNTNPAMEGAQLNRNSFIPGNGQAEINTPIISYVTCYVGCSHVTNIITNSAGPATLATFNPLTISFILASTILLLLF